MGCFSNAYNLNFFGSKPFSSAFGKTLGAIPIKAFAPLVTSAFVRLRLMQVGYSQSTPVGHSLACTANLTRAGEAAAVKDAGADQEDHMSAPLFTLLLTILATLSTSALAQKIYKCEGHYGSISYSEVPCPSKEGNAEHIGTTRKGTAESSEEVMSRMLRATEILRGDDIRPEPIPSRPASAASAAPSRPSNPDMPYPVEINDREVEYDPRQSDLDRRLDQIRNKVNDPRPQDGSRHACTKARPARGIIKVGREEVWVGMSQLEVRRRLGTPRSVNSFLVGQEQWAYTKPNGGSLFVIFNGLCASSMR